MLRSRARPRDAVLFCVLESGFLLPNEHFQAFVLAFQLGLPVALIISGEADRARLQELALPGVDQALFDAMLPRSFSHAQLTAQDR